MSISRQAGATPVFVFLDDALHYNLRGDRHGGQPDQPEPRQSHINRRSGHSDDVELYFCRPLDSKFSQSRHQNDHCHCRHRHSVHYRGIASNDRFEQSTQRPNQYFFSTGLDCGHLECGCAGTYFTPRTNHAVMGGSHYCFDVFLCIYQCVISTLFGLGKAQTIQLLSKYH